MQTILPVVNVTVLVEPTELYTRSVQGPDFLATRCDRTKADLKNLHPGTACETQSVLPCQLLDVRCAHSLFVKLSSVFLFVVLVLLGFFFGLVLCNRI